RSRPVAPPAEKPKRQPKELAGWLERWPKPTVSSRDIRIWGPKVLHDRERAIRSAEILVAHARLHPHPLKPRVWEIVRDPSPPAVDRRLNIRNFPRNTFSGPHLSRFRASAGFPPRKEMASKFGSDFKNAKLDRILNIPPRRNEVSPLFRRVHFIKFAAAFFSIFFFFFPPFCRGDIF